MSRRSSRPPDTPALRASADSTGDALPRYHRCLREIHRAHLASERGRIDREAFLTTKLTLLRTAVRDADAKGAGERLVELMHTLRLTCAVNDVEVESVRRYLDA